MVNDREPTHNECGFPWREHTTPVNDADIMPPECPRVVTPNTQTDKEPLVENLGRLLDEALGALNEVFMVAANEGSDAAIEWVGDWLNARDSVDEDRITDLDRWAATRRGVRVDREALTTAINHGFDVANEMWVTARHMEAEGSVVRSFREYVVREIVAALAPLLGLPGAIP